MKYNYCEKYRMPGPWGVGDRCSNFQRDALITHEKSWIHKDAQAKWINATENKIKSIPNHVLEIEDVNKERIITTMKTTYFVCQEDLSLAKYEKICKFLMDLKTPNMPKKSRLLYIHKS